MKSPHQFLRWVLAIAPLALVAQPAAPVAPPVPLGSTVFKWEDLNARPTGNGERRDVTDRPTATLERFESHITTLLAGRMSHPPHQHGQEELIILRDGTLDVTINGATTRAGPGSLLFFAANDFHNVQNVGETPATYFVFNFATAVTKTVPKAGAAAMAVPGKLGSRVFDWQQLEVKPTKTGERRAVVDSPTTTLANFECHVTTLQAGVAAHAAHRHPDEEIILVKEGVLDVTINGVTTRAGAGSILFYGSNDEHGIRNAGDTTASYYVIRVVTAPTLTPFKS
jgi:quercetin dioxygenase-like cupin family protein